jgi:DNA ligase
MTRQEYLNAIEKLNEHTKYYDAGMPLISDEEWDNLYFEISKYEEETGFISENSPTSSISYQVVNKLEKVTHSHPMLSLSKTKSIEDLKSFSNDETILMAKMDGLTCSLTYKKGVLTLAETRGNGIIGENITHNAMVIDSIPKRLDTFDDLTVDGEIICDYDSFEEFSNEFKNPRNFASGSIRLLDSEECSKRKLSFVAWDLINSEFNTLEENLNYLDILGFITVPRKIFEDDNDIELLREECKFLSYPIDGLVLKINDIEAYKSLGSNDHHPLGGIAFKFYDELYDTELEDIIWSTAKTGIITPIAKFKPVEIDGTSISKASLHNLSIMKDILGSPYAGQKIRVFKANMIIPQVASAEKREVGNIEIPEHCPSCGEELVIEKLYNTEVLKCNNAKCPSKVLYKLNHFIGKNGLDIDSLSVKTLEKLIELGWLSSLSDIFMLKNHREEWIELDGFKEHSVDKILNQIPEEIELWKILASLGIPDVNKSMAKKIVEYFNNEEECIDALLNQDDFSKINGIGKVLADNIKQFDYTEFKDILKCVSIKKKKSAEEGKLSNLNFCITGSLNYFKNRDELVKVIEDNGGKITGVSKKLNYLINNDSASTSSKNKKANELNIPIITEEEFLNLFDLK